MKIANSMSGRQRTYGLGIWALGLGYFLFYAPYSGLTRALSRGLLPAIGGPVNGTVLLPASVAALVVAMLVFITAMGWWKFAGHRRVFGISVPFPRRLTFLSGVCLATIMGTTTLVFTFAGVSIVFVLVLLRGGVLIIAPAVDLLVGRRVRWFSWSAMSISTVAVLITLGDAANYSLSLGAILTVAAYLLAYFIKFQLMSKMAKTEDQDANLRYFVEEQMVTSPLLLLALVAMAFVGFGEPAIGFRTGLTTFLASDAVFFALLVGLLYAGLCVCTTLIFLDRRENTFCIPMHCGSSMLAGIAASYALNIGFGQPQPSAPQLTGAGLIIVALAFLSPLHHLRRFAARLRSWIGLRNRFANVAPARMKAESLGSVVGSGRVLLFVCSGNTCRSPIAAAIGNAEIASRFHIPVESLDSAKLPAVSAGISVTVGSPMNHDAQEALRLLGIPVMPHSARNLTVELAQEVERIYCMTEAHRNAVIGMIPAAAAKTQCLDPNGDVEDPLGSGLAAYVNCARRIHSLVRIRFDEIGLQAQTQS